MQFLELSVRAIVGIWHSWTILHIIFPESFILGSIRPYLNTFSVSDILFPLSFISSSVLEDELFTLFVSCEIFRLTLCTNLVPIILGALGKLEHRKPPRETVGVLLDLAARRREWARRLEGPPHGIR